MEWDRFCPSAVPPLYWFDVPVEVIRKLRPMGFHFGYTLKGDVEKLLRGVFDDPSSSLENCQARLRRWADIIDREAALLSPGKSTLWHPRLTEQDRALIRVSFGSRLVEIRADTLEEALHGFRLTKWNFGAFYHVACTGSWKLVIEAQLSRLQEVGLTGIYAGVVGSDADYQYFLERAKYYCVEVATVFRHCSMRVFELPTIHALETWAADHPGHYTLYFHTKGVSQPYEYLRMFWRRVMEECVIARWRENAALLRDGYDLVGVNWREVPPISHFPGNFWMARTDFLGRLEKFSSYCRNPRHRRCRLRARFSAEFWLGSASVAPRLHSYLQSEIGSDNPRFYQKPLPGISGYLALCLYCRNEGPYLAEWLDYHFALGVSHVILIDNNSEPSLDGFVLPYAAGGKVTLLQDKDVSSGRQCRAYAGCLALFGPQFRWIGFIDTDEFLVPKDGRSLPDFLRDYEDFGGLGVYWYCFGSNGHKAKPPSTLQAFTKRSDDNFSSNNHIKTIVNTQHVSPEIPRDPHHFIYKNGYCCVDENKRPIHGPRGQLRTSGLIQLNHYVVRSEEEYREKSRRLGGNCNLPHATTYFDDHDRHSNALEDRLALELFERATGEFAPIQTSVRG